MKAILTSCCSQCSRLRQGQQGTPDDAKPWYATKQEDVVAAGTSMEERLDHLVKYQTWKSWSWSPDQPVFHTEQSFRCNHTRLLWPCGSCNQRGGVWGTGGGVQVGREVGGQGVIYACRTNGALSFFTITDSL